ncbi:hypothetical protein FY150_17220 [Agrobacterium tumefaciens]|nr:hypothetical protein FY150_17220 [Agrobacterium tumefaciens]
MLDSQRDFSIEDQFCVWREQAKWKLWRNALFLKDLAAKTHRRIRSRVEDGKSGGWKFPVLLIEPWLMAATTQTAAAPYPPNVRYNGPVGRTCELTS